MGQPLIIAEVKTRSPFAWVSPHSWLHLFALANVAGDWLSIHTDDRWGGSLEQIATVRKMTLRPILAKGIHATDAEVHQALDAGADIVLVVGRIPSSDLLPKCLLEPNTIEEMSALPRGSRVVWNARDLRTGGQKTETFEEARRKWTGWLCQASLLTAVEDVRPGADAVLVGTHLPEFWESMKTAGWAWRHSA